jgi:hypothetical protein
MDNHHFSYITIFLKRTLYPLGRVVGRKETDEGAEKKQTNKGGERLA